MNAPDAATPLRDRVAIALHDAECADRHCNGAALGAYYRQADIAIPLIEAEARAAERQRWEPIVYRLLNGETVNVADLLDGAS